jgi:hypothetical protein
MEVTHIPEDLGKRIIELARIAAMMHRQSNETRGGGEFGEGADRAPTNKIWPHDRLLDRPMEWPGAGREAA